MQRRCSRSNWFQEILFPAVSLFSTSHLFFSPSHSFFLLLSLSLEERGSKIQRDRKTAGSAKEERNEIEGEDKKKGVERERETNIQLDIIRDLLSIFFQYFLSPFIPSASYHATAAPLRVVSRGISTVVSYRLPRNGYTDG